MAITPKQEKFAQSIADGMSQADAYRTAFNCAKSKPQTVVENASRLMANSNISARVAFLREKLSEKALWTREDSVRTLKSVLADGDAKPNDKTAAVKVLNDMHGFNAPTKLEVDGSIIVEIVKFGAVNEKL
jgi:hypothetical protein